MTNTDEDCGRIGSVSARIVFNPNIQPETSRSRSAGMVWDVNKDTSFTMDYFDIRRDAEIDRFSSGFQVNALFNGDQRFAPFVFRDSNPLSWIPGVPNSGPVIGVDRAWLNLGTSQVTGIDIEMSHRQNIGEMGKVTSTASMTYNISSKASREKGDPLINYVGGVNTETTGNGLPRFRGNIGFTWEKGDWSAGALLNYIGGWNNYSSKFDCAGNLGAAVSAAIPEVCRTRSWRTLDVNAAYTGIKNLTLRLVIRNLTDEMPPFDYNDALNAANVTLGYNPQYHNPLGIYPSLSATYTFK